MVHGQNTNGTWAMYELYMMIIPNENRAQSIYLQTKRGRIFLTRPPIIRDNTKLLLSKIPVTHLGEGTGSIGSFAISRDTATFAQVRRTVSRSGLCARREDKAIYFHVHPRRAGAYILTLFHNLLFFC